MNTIKRSSVIDHLYTNTPELITEISPVDTDIGNHKIVTFIIPSKHKVAKKEIKKDWWFYSKEKLVARL